MPARIGGGGPVLPALPVRFDRRTAVVRVERQASSRFIGRDVVWNMMPPDAACRRGGPTRNEAEE